MKSISKISNLLLALTLGQSLGASASVQSENWPRVILSKNLKSAFDNAPKILPQKANFSFERGVKPIECRHLNLRVDENFRSLSLLKTNTDDASFLTLSSKILSNWNEIWGKNLGMVEASFKWPKELSEEDFKSSFKIFVVDGFSELSNEAFKLIELENIETNLSQDAMKVKEKFNYMDLCRSRSLNVYIFPRCRVTSPSQLSQCLGKDLINFEIALSENERDQDLELRRK